jgi:hypothetical protein
VADKLIFLAFRILEIMFFTGAVGCVLAIIVAWIEIVSEAVTPDDPADNRRR